MHLVPETRLKYDLPYSLNFPAVLLASGSPYLTSPIYESTSQHSIHTQEHGIPVTEHERASTTSVPLANQAQYVKPYHAAVLVEPRLDRVKPSEWTSVCKDDGLLRDILTAYFMHEYHTFPVFHLDYFFEDMQSPRTNKRDIRFCSALLVNAVLAYGCVGQYAEREGFMLISLHSTVQADSAIALDIGIPTVSATDSLLKLRGSGKFRQLMVTDPNLCQFRQ
jgi:hypothetical protein